MLQSLFIQNYALIDQLDLNLSQGFSVITGETGAGKSIILGAIGLLLGQRAEIRAIRSGASKCTIEAHFDIANYNLQHFFKQKELEYDDECIIRRELYANGKSRAFINDMPVQLSQMRDLGELLVDIHSQHRNLLLGKEDFQLHVVDTLAGDAMLLNEYADLYKQWQKLRTEIKELEEQAQKDKQEQDFLQFQFDQLEETNLKEGEQESLEEEQAMLSHAEEIKSALFGTAERLDNDEYAILSKLKDSLSAIEGIKDLYQPAIDFYNRLNSCYIELKDIACDISSQAEEIAFNPQRLEAIEERLDTIYTLQKKHGAETVEELITLRNKLQERLNSICGNSEQIETLKKRVKELHALLMEKAQALTSIRKKAAQAIEQELTGRLLPLGIPNVQFVVDITPTQEATPNGMDKIEFLFSANKKGALQPISDVASGGEIARVMLCIKAMIAGATNLPTIIFDEIDTGVSGEIADHMAESMQEMARHNSQVISITHLPQIASKGETHYLVYKEDNDTETNSHIRCLSMEERVTEIARMLSGAKLTEAALTNARELLHNNQNKS